MVITTTLGALWVLLASFGYLFLVLLHSWRIAGMAERSTTPIEPSSIFWRFVDRSGPMGVSIVFVVGALVFLWRYVGEPAILQTLELSKIQNTTTLQLVTAVEGLKQMAVDVKTSLLLQQAEREQVAKLFERWLRSIEDDNGDSK